tara:strand:+ start:513 stop:809 length:297 start_codon:yes stop_codon:yes gene_type:complete
MIEDITDLSNILIYDSSGNEINFNENDIKVIMTQTNYTREYAKQKLLIHNDPLIVIKEYLNPENIKPKNKENKKSFNQEIYSQIRNKFYDQKMNSIKY